MRRQHSPPALTNVQIRVFGMIKRPEPPRLCGYILPGRDFYELRVVEVKLKNLSLLRTNTLSV